MFSTGDSPTKEPLIGLMLLNGDDAAFDIPDLWRAESSVARSSMRPSHQILVGIHAVLASKRCASNAQRQPEVADPGSDAGSRGRIYAAGPRSWTETSSSVGVVWRYARRGRD
jgi:hypothetical protein